MEVHGSTTAIITMIMIVIMIMIKIMVTVTVTITVMVMVMVTVTVTVTVTPAFVAYMPDDEPHPPSHFNVAYKPDAQILFVTVT